MKKNSEQTEPVSRSSLGDAHLHFQARGNRRGWAAEFSASEPLGAGVPARKMGSAAGWGGRARGTASPVSRCCPGWGFWFVFVFNLVSEG